MFDKNYYADYFRPANIAVFAVCAYFILFPIPFKWDWPLFLLASLAFLITALPASNSVFQKSPLFVPVVLFLCATVLSIIASVNVFRSFALSLPLLPAIILFYLIAQYFSGLQHIRLFYASASVMSLGVSLALLWQLHRHTHGTPSAWISNLGSPVFVVPNDVILLAVIAPLSVALLWGEQRLLLKILAAASIATTTIVIVSFQSRGALLVMFVGTGLAVGLVRPRMGAAIGLATVTVAIIVDGLLGFPLLNKFGQQFSEWPPPRLSLWLAAWNMFRDAPLMGHGTHTYALLYQSYLDSVPATLPATRWAHNLYLEVLAEQGLLGLAALGGLLFSGGRLALRLRRVGQREVRVYGVGALSALVGLCIAGFYEASLLRLWVTVTLFSVLGVVAFLSRAEAGSS